MYNLLNSPLKDFVVVGDNNVEKAKRENGFSFNDVISNYKRLLGLILML